MPKITQIAAQQKNKNRISVFVDKKYSFSLTLDQMIELRLHAGQEIAEEDIRGYVKLSQDGKYYERAIQKLARRQHSEFEIRKYLQQKEASEELISQIVEKLLSKNYLNDQSFAQMWVRNGRELKNRSSRMLRLELRQKGIDSAVIDQVLEESEDDEMIALKQLIEKKKRLSRYQDRQKFIQYLVGKGFSYSKVQAVLDEELD